MLLTVRFASAALIVFAAVPANTAEAAGKAKNTGYQMVSVVAPVVYAAAVAPIAVPVAAAPVAVKPPIVAPSDRAADCTVERSFVEAGELIVSWFCPGTTFEPGKAAKYDAALASSAVAAAYLPAGPVAAANGGSGAPIQVQPAREIWSFGHFGGTQVRTATPIAHSSVVPAPVVPAPVIPAAVGYTSALVYPQATFPAVTAVAYSHPVATLPVVSSIAYAAVQPVVYPMVTYPIVTYATYLMP